MLKSLSPDGTITLDVPDNAISVDRQYSSQGKTISANLVINYRPYLNNSMISQVFKATSHSPLAMLKLHTWT